MARQSPLYLISLVQVVLVLGAVTRPSSPGRQDVTTDHDNTTYDPALDGDESEGSSLPADNKQERWAEAGYHLMQGLNCREPYLTSPKECRRLSRLSRAQVGVHFAGPSPRTGRLRATLPDGGLRGGAPHDVVMVIDPHPGANFGHLVLVFYIDLRVDIAWCRLEGGNYLGGGECLTLALKRRCKNALERRGRRRNFFRRCEINFLPFVYGNTTKPRDRKQLLHCRAISGFATCPKLRSANETSELFCIPVRDNTRRCETSHEIVRTSCRVFEICDQAVLLSGGWNRWTLRPYHWENIKDMYAMLRRNGFQRKAIKVFFANGVQAGIPDPLGGPPHPAHPAAFKLALRYHLQRVCSSPHCADTLTLYLNNPARQDGGMLLWDINGDGQVDEDEVYLLNELLEDISQCEARQVHLIVDQSFSGHLARAFGQSSHHGNVMVFSSSRDHQYSYGREFTRIWVGANHTTTCMKGVFREARSAIDQSRPIYGSGSQSSNVNLFGAPCDVIPPFTDLELNQNYLGCQNLPTALWVMKFLGSPRRKMTIHLPSWVIERTDEVPSSSLTIIGQSVESSVAGGEEVVRTSASRGNNTATRDTSGSRILSDSGSYPPGSNT